MSASLLTRVDAFTKSLEDATKVIELFVSEHKDMKTLTKKGLHDDFEQLEKKHDLPSLRSKYETLTNEDFSGDKRKAFNKAWTHFKDALRAVSALSRKFETNSGPLLAGGTRKKRKVNRKKSTRKH
jgi:hypothetical protein